jgi:hypothetical protein
MDDCCTTMFYIVYMHTIALPHIISILTYQAGDMRMHGAEPCSTEALEERKIIQNLINEDLYRLHVYT